jgi:hypothetical protein
MPFVISALRLRRFPRYPEFGERLARGPRKSVLSEENGVAGKIRYNGATIDAVAQAHEPILLHESAKDTKDLILAAKIAELSRQEYIFAGFPRHPCLDLSAQCLRSGMPLPCKNPAFTIYKNLTVAARIEATVAPAVSVVEPLTRHAEQTAFRQQRIGLWQFSTLPNGFRLREGDPQTSGSN